MIAWDEARPEVPHEIVIARLGMRCREMREASDEPLFHRQSRIFVNDGGYLVGGELLELEADHVEPDASRAQRHFRLLVEANGRCRVERHAVPDQTRAS